MSTAVRRLEPLRFDTKAVVQCALLVAVFFAVFWRMLAFIPNDAGVLGALVHVWVSEADWSHGPIIPIFSAYLFYLRWDRARWVAPRHTWVGLPIIVSSLAAYIVLWWGSIPIGYLRSVAMLLCLLGIIIFIFGTGMLRYVAIPWLYLFFAIPLPKGIYFQLTDPLRRWSATVATAVLDLMPDLQIDRTGSIIEYYYQGATGSLGVADACSGMRSTITLCALGVAVAFMAPRPWWQRAILIASCIPIAVFSNFIRVTTTCVLFIYVDQKYAGGNYHMTLGLITLLLAFGMFSGLGWILRRLFVEVDEDDEDDGRSPQASQERGTPGAGVEPGAASS